MVIAGLKLAPEAEPKMNAGTMTARPHAMVIWIEPAPFMPDLLRVTFATTPSPSRISIIAQILGGIVGGVLVYILFKDHFDATEDPGTKLGVFSTGPSIPNTVRNIVQEAIATFVLVFAICGLNQVPELNDGVGKLLVFGIIVSIGMSLGGLTGYALNPARDLGPRIAHAILPIKGKGSSNFKYGLIVPIFGPIIGGLLAVLLYNVIPWAAV